MIFRLLFAFAVVAAVSIAALAHLHPPTGGVCLSKLNGECIKMSFAHTNIR
jgi:hypothetical protein